MSYMYNATITNNNTVDVANINIRTIFETISLDNDVHTIEANGGTLEFQCTCGGAWEQPLMKFCTNNGYKYGNNGLKVSLVEIPDEEPE